MLTMKDIIREGNPLLKAKSIDVQLPLSNEDEQLIIDMMEYIYNSIDDETCKKYDLRPAVGLAAPQLGILKKMIAIVAPDENGKEHEFALINPKLISYSDELIYLEGGEGCLSVDRKCDALIHRPKRVTFEAYVYDFQSRKLNKQKIRLSGYLAVVFQHEYDHLNGVLFVDRANQDNPYFIPDNSTPIKFNFEEE